MLDKQERNKARKTIKSVSDTMRKGKQPSDEQIDQVAADAIQVFGEVLLSIEQSLGTIAKRS